MLKKLLLASALTLAFSGTAMAEDAPMPVAPGCTSCALPTSNASAPVKMAQVQMQAQQARGRAVTRGDWENGPKEPRICCDPQLNNIKFSDYFIDDISDPDPATYGLKFNTANPNYATVLQPAMNNTATLAGILSPAGVNNGWLLVTGEMKTDNDDFQAFDGSSPTPASDFWNAPTTTTSLPLQLVYADPVLNVNPAVGWAWTGAFNDGSLGAGHMARNGTRYAIKFSFWHYYRVNDTWYVEQVLCNNSKDHYLGRIKSDVTAKIGQGGSGAASVAIADQGASPANARTIKLSPPRVVSAAEMQALPARLRDAMMKGQ
jgi:hypothetical protein